MYTVTGLLFTWAVRLQGLLFTWEVRLHSKHQEDLPHANISEYFTILHGTRLRRTCLLHLARSVGHLVRYVLGRLKCGKEL